MARVLVVEDYPDLAESLVAGLSLEGHVVHTAADGGSGLLQLGLYRPDVVVLDLMLPRVSGWQFLEVKSQLGEVRDIPVILCSGWVDVGGPPASLPGGAPAAILEKPVDLDCLGALIRKVLREKDKTCSVSCP
jgi:DNA-binding response OmpR family regulator